MRTLRYWIPGLLLLLAFGGGPAVAQQLQPAQRGAVLAGPPADQPPPWPFKDKSYALVIGNDDYQPGNGWKRLTKAVEDAKEVAKVLEKHDFKVTLRTNLKSQELKTELSQFFDTTGRDSGSRLFLWYAGHGETVAHPQLNQKEAYLIPVDAPRTSDADFRSKAVSLRTLGGYMRDTHAKHVLAVFDSCFSGDLFTNLRNTADSVTHTISRKLALPVRQIISAGSAGEPVRDDGAFRRQFMKALTGDEDVPRQARGFISAKELDNFLETRITNLTNGQQKPHLGRHPDYLNDGDFVFEIRDADGRYKVPPAPPVVQTSMAPQGPPPGSGGQTESYRVDGTCLNEWRGGLITSRDEKKLCAFAQKCRGTMQSVLAEDRAVLFSQKKDCGAVLPPSAVPVDPAAQPGILSRTFGWLWGSSSPTPGAPVAPPLKPVTSEEAAEWRIANEVNTAKSYEAFIQKWSESRYLDEAKAALALQQRRKYTLTDVEKAATQAAEAMRGRRLVHDRMSFLLEDEDKKTCALDGRTKSLLRGFAISRLYFYGFMALLRHGELTPDTFNEAENFDSPEKPTSNPRALALDLGLPSILSSMVRLKAQQSPFAPHELADIKALARELVAQKRKLDAKVTEPAFKDWLKKDEGIETLGLPKSANRCHHVHIGFADVGLAIPPKAPGEKSTIEVIGGARLDDWLYQFWIKRMREGNAAVAERMLALIAEG